jgi:hypothetical protein
MPRRYTPPLVTGPPGPCGCGCALTEETSAGFAIDAWARDALQRPLDPWQRWLVIHAHELRPDGTLRFSTILVLVARQNGKTELLVILTLYWIFALCLAMVLGTSTKLDYARESWMKAVKLARSIPALRQRIPFRGGVRKTNGEQELVATGGSFGDVDDLDACRYKIAASNEEGGRSLTINRLILDELRQHHSYEAYDASEPATSGVDDAQIWALSNAGSDKSVVLNDLHDAALEYIATGDGDDDFMLAEWSSLANADPTDVRALAMANPNMGLRKPTARLLANARRAVAAGGAKLAGFKTEHMCIRVKALNPALDPTCWEAAAVDVGLGEVPRGQLAMVYDVALSGDHATLYAAAMLADDRVRIDVVKEWRGPGCATRGLREVQGIVGALLPRKFGWLPVGPAAAAAARLADRTKRNGGRRGEWPPPGVEVEEIRGDTAAVCMGFADMVDSGDLERSRDPLLNAQAETAEWLTTGGTRVFSRAGGGPCDALYAAAGAVHLARTLPPPIGDIRILLPRVRGPR